MYYVFSILYLVFSINANMYLSQTNFLHILNKIYIKYLFLQTN